MRNLYSGILAQLGLFILASSLSSCCCTIDVKPEGPPPAEVSNAKESFEKIHPQINKISTWSISGKLGLISKAKSGSADFTWKQADQNYKIHIAGPFGQGTMNLTGKPGDVELSTADGKVRKSTDARKLLQDATGWNLPVDNLLYWIRGIPAPGVVTEQKLNKYGTLENLHQAGWNINYETYQSVNKIPMPAKMVLSYQDLTLKIVITRWEF